MIGKTLSHYEIVAELGRGGMGIVYRATDPKLKRDVAIKVLPTRLTSDEDRARFMREAQSAARLNHPNIATIHEVNEDDGFPFIVMELVDGITLEDRIAQGDLEYQEAARISRQIASGLAAAHDSGIVHRDIKPANILVARDGRVKILDFGLAKSAEGMDITKDGSTVGTAFYMSPEQVRGEEVGWQTDAWSLGAVMYEMISGRRAFDGAYEAAVSFQILNETPVPLAELKNDVPDDLRQMVDTLLSKEPDDRGASLHPVAEQLDNLMQPGPRSAVSVGDSVAEAIAPFGVMSNTLWAGLGLIVVVTLAAVWFLRTSDSPTELDGPARKGIAVFPFSVQGDPNLEYFGPAVPSLLRTTLDASGGWRSVDPNALMGYLEENNLVVSNPDAALDVVNNFQAEGFILGNILRAGGPIRISAQLYNTEGEVEANADVTVTDDSLLFGAIDEVTRQLMADRFAQTNDRTRSIGVLSSTSFAALNRFLIGETAMREGRYTDAFSEYRQAVAEDSTFALAWLRLANASGFGENPSTQIKPAIENAFRYMDRLPEREQRLITGEKAFHDGEIELAENTLNDLTRDYPDDVQAWASLGDTQYHYNPILGRSALESKYALQKAVKLDPGNAELTLHLKHIALEEEDFDRYDSLETSTNPIYGSFSRFQRDLVGNDEDLRNAAIDSVAALGSRGLNLGIVRAFIMFEDFDLAERLGDAIIQQAENASQRLNGNMFIGFSKMAAGKRTGARSYFASVDSVFGRPQTYFSELYMSNGLPRDPNLLLEAYDYAQGLDSTFYSDVRAFSDAPLADFHAAQIGTLANYIGDKPELERQLQRLEASSHRLSRSLMWNLRSAAAYAEGDYEAAIEAADLAVVKATWQEYSNPTLSPVVSMVSKIESYYALGDYENTIRWLDALGDGLMNSSIHFLVVIPHVAYMYYLRAKSYDALGEQAEAVHYYTRFIEMWEDADADLQPLVRDARERLDQLLLTEQRESAP